MYQKRKGDWRIGFTVGYQILGVNKLDGEIEIENSPLVNQRSSGQVFREGIDMKHLFISGVKKNGCWRLLKTNLVSKSCLDKCKNICLILCRQPFSVQIFPKYCHSLFELQQILWPFYCCKQTSFNLYPNIN